MSSTLAASGLKEVFTNNDPGLSVDDKVASLFQPDSLLAGQYYATFRRKAGLEPEKKLMLTVLEDAIVCFQNYILAHDPKGKEIFHEAEEWILEENSDCVFSFENICEVLGFNPKYIRKGLLRWQEKRLAHV